MLLECKVFLELAKHCEPCFSFRKGCAPMCEHTWANAMFKHVRTFVIRTMSEKEEQETEVRC